MTLSKDRLHVLIGAALALIIVALAVGEGIAGSVKWVLLGTGLLLLMTMVGATGNTRLELYESRQKLRKMRRERDELSHYFNALMDYVPSYIYFKDRDSKFLQVNRAMVELMGAESVKDIIGKSDVDYFDADLAKKKRQDELDVIETGEGHEKYIEERNSPGGGEQWVLSSKLPFRDADGRIIGTFGISSDVTEMIEAQHSLEMERNTLRVLLDSIPDSIYIRDPHGKYTVVNRALADLVGIKDPQEVEGKTPFDFFPKEDAEAFLAEDTKIMEAGKTVTSPARISRRANGEYRHLITTKVPVRNREGKVSGILGINRDVTEQERAREAVRRTEHRMQEIVDNSPSPMYAKSRAGQYLMVNRRYEDLFGVKAEDVVGKTDLEIIKDEEVAKGLQENDALVFEKGEPVQFDEVLNLGEGDRAYVSVKFPMRDLDGTIYAVGGISTDITERKKAEEELKNLNKELMDTYDNLTKAHEQLIQAEKMESVGRLAAGVAHEVKNPLAMIGMGLELLARRLPDDDVKGKETIERMKRGIDRAKKIVRGLVDYSSDRRLEFSRINPNVLIRESLELVEYQLKEAGIEVMFSKNAELPEVQADQTKIEQVLVNIFINAMHSMDGGGTLTVKAKLMSMSNVGHDEGSRLRERMREGDKMVKIIVTDTGKGIPEEALGKLFDPFFTTKPTGKGTGLGLTVARKIADLHGGEMTLTNRPDGKGAMATLSLRVEND
ncbi:MAG: PAS domain-containing protein [Akkermansiaceae bacterium]|jgi:PAS domain S-box-containing protein|nr:PAS domain-containing protein [Akkermansiaceae bacterium]MDP4645584.1 PAS domain-containing protein [Akkermansiaceae bacterium]MDP4719947.1 PAS domain-containing protein [Akkermansiaceae bacterium]MDP4779776.1 PAS domain-containing protein [Akkermansiaceae bacterium]MDP4846580.1 PAS domain-containing protein [Akkermansiaceae bacterium]